MATVRRTIGSPLPDYQPVAADVCHAHSKSDSGMADAPDSADLDW